MRLINYIITELSTVRKDYLRTDFDKYHGLLQLPCQPRFAAFTYLLEKLLCSVCNSIAAMPARSLFCRRRGRHSFAPIL